MFCVGSTAYLVGEHSKTAIVHGFSPDPPSVNYKIVDRALLYECPYTERKLILLAQNALHVPSMQHNLVPPFILREDDVAVNEVPKIHQKAPMEEHHSLFFSRVDLRIPMSLTGIFSCFKTRMPTNCKLQDDSIPVVTMTPTHWNPITDLEFVNGLARRRYSPSRPTTNDP